MASIVKGDLVEFRTGFGGVWQAGYVETIEPHQIQVRAIKGQRLHTIRLGGQGRKGKVRPLTGARCVETVSGARAAALPPITPALRVVRTGPAELHAVPAPRPRYRSGAYLAFVRTHPCCRCAAPDPSDAHHQGARGVGQKADDYLTVPLCRPCHQEVTDTGALPGLDRGATELLILRTQVALLSDWSHSAEALVADHVDVPVLRRCAS